MAELQGEHFIIDAEDRASSVFKQVGKNANDAFDTLEKVVAACGEKAEQASQKITGAAKAGASATVMSLKEIKQELRDAQAELKELEKQSIGTNYNDGLEEKQRKLRVYEKTLAETEANFQKAQSKGWATSDDSGWLQAIEKAKSMVAETKNEIEAASTAWKQQTESINAAKEKVDSLKAAASAYSSSGKFISITDTDGNVDITNLKQRIEEMRSSSEQARTAIAGMSEESQRFAERAAVVKTELDGMVKDYQLMTSKEGKEVFTDDERAKALDAINAKIKEYDSLVAQSTATAQTAYGSQGEYIKSMEQELKNLNEVRQYVTENGDTKTGGELVQTIQEMQKEIDKAKAKYEELKNMMSQRLATQNLSIAPDLTTQTNGIITRMKEVGNDIKTSVNEWTGHVKTKMADMWSSFKNSSAGQAVTDTTTKIKTSLSELATSFSNNSHVKFFSDSMREVGSSVSGLTSKFGEFMTGHGKFKAGIKEISSAFDNMGIPLSAATAGVNRLLVSMRAMIATPIGAVITAVAAAFGTFNAFLHKSAEGQRVLVKLSAACSSIFSSLMDIVITLGQYLYHSFADAGAPLHDYAKTLVSTLKTAFKAVGDIVTGFGTMVKGVFTLDWDTFKEGFKTYSEGLVGAGTAIVQNFKNQFTGAIGAVKTLYNAVTDDKLGATLSKQVYAIGSNLSRDIKLADEMKQAERDMSKATEIRAKNEAEVAELREKIYTLSGQEKLDTINKAIEKTEALYAGQITQQEKINKLEEERNGLHTKSLEVIAAERKNRIALYQLQAQQASATRFLTRQQQSTIKQMANAQKTEGNKENSVTQAQEKYNEAERKAAAEQAELYQNLEEQVEDARIAAIKDGAERVRQERDRQLEKDLLQLNKQREAAIAAEVARQKSLFDAQQPLIKEQGGKVKLWDPDTMVDKSQTEKINAYYEKLRQYRVDADTNQNKEEEEAAMRDYLKEYGTFQEQKLAIEQEYDEKIEKARTDGDKKRLQKEKEKAVNDLVFTNLQKSPEYTRAFGNLDEASIATLQYLKNQFEEAMKNQSIDTSDPEALQKYVDVINSIDEKLVERDPFGTIRTSTEALTKAEERRAAAKKKLQQLESQGKKGTDEYKKTTKELAAAEDDVLKNENKRKKAVETVNSAISELAQSFDELGSTIGGTEGQILQAIGDVLNFVVTCSNAMQTVATAASTAIGTIEKASAILAIISAAIQLAQAISQLLPDAYDEYEKYAAKISEINTMREAVDEYAVAVAKARAEEKEWFSGTSLRNLQDYAKVGTEAMEAYNEKLYEQQATYQNKSGAGWLTKAGHWVTKLATKLNPVHWINKGVTAVLDAVGVDTDSKFFKTLEKVGDIGANAFWYGPIAGLVTASDALDKNKYTYEKGTSAAIDNLRIETRKASKGFLGSGIGGKSQRTEDLRTWVKTNLGLDLFDEDNMLNTEAYEVIMENYEDKLVGQTKQTLEYLKNMADEYNEWIEQLEEYVSDLYNPVIENFTDALWDWFDEGKSALDSFKDYASDTFRDIVTDMMQTIMLNDFIDEYSENLKEAYRKYGVGELSYAGLIDTVTSSTATAIQAYKESLPIYKDVLTAINEELSEIGIDLHSGSVSQDSSYGSASTITQEQAGELSGRLTAIQWAQQTISNNVVVILSLITSNNSILNDMRTLAVTGNEYLADIQADTRKIYSEWGAKIDKIQKSLAGI